MTKLCSVCSTENRDDVQFCRACGTAFPTLASAAAEAPDDEPLAPGIACDECGFQNKPGVRYCANCGVSLLGTVIVPRSRAGAPAAADPYAALSPPPISYPSFAPVAPYPQAPQASTPPGYPSAYEDPLGNPDIPDPDAAIAVREQEAYDAPAGPAAPPFATASATNRTPLIVGAVVLAVAAAAGAWWFMGSSGRIATPVATPASAPEVAAPVAASAAVPAAIASAPVTATVDAAASTPLTGIVPPEIAIPSSGPFSTLPAPPPLTTAPPAAAVVVEATPVDPAADAEAKRLAAEKRREKAAKDKAEREAKAKALTDQQQAAAAARAEQEAQTRRRADEAAQRVRPSVAIPVAPPPVTSQARGVREICAGRGSISEAVCQSRECGAAEHFNEAICRQIRDADERRRNYTN